MCNVNSPSVPRIVSWFSCGAASAVATKLAIQNANGREVVVAYCDTFKREHPDNRRFFKDCERWFGQEILVLANDEFERDPDVVFRKTRFLVGPKGAARALLAERERCAKIADKWLESDWLDEVFAARSIAAAIRQDNPNAPTT